MVVPEEEIAPSQARIPLEHGVSVQTANDGGRRRILAGLGGLPTNTEEIGDEIPINEMCRVCGESGSRVIHVEAWRAMESAFRPPQF